MQYNTLPYVSKYNIDIPVIDETDMATDGPHYPRPLAASARGRRREMLRDTCIAIREVAFCTHVLLEYRGVKVFLGSNVLCSLF